MADTILVIEDEALVRDLVVLNLKHAGYDVTSRANFPDGAKAIRESGVSLAIVDVMLPGGEGFQLVREARDAGVGCPILMLTARSEVQARVRGLDCGADDFLSKPFSYVVLLARLRALLRRGRGERPPVLTAGDLRLDPAAHEVSRGGDDIALTARQFALLELLMRRSGEVLSKAEILEHVWDFAFEGDPNIVEVYVRQLRQRIDEPFGRQSLQTVRLVGYRVVDDR